MFSNDFSKSVWTSLFSIQILHFAKQKLLGFIEVFANFEANCLENKLKTDKIYFFLKDS